MMFSFLSNVSSDYRSPFAQLEDFDKPDSTGRAPPKPKTKDVANLSVHPETLDSKIMPYQLIKTSQNMDFPDISWGEFP